MASFSLYSLSFALCLSSGFQQGYIASVLNQPYVFMERFINASFVDHYQHGLSVNSLDILWSLLNVIFPVATILGQFLAASLCARIGRKKTALFSAALYVPGTLASYFSMSANSFELLFVGRIIWFASDFAAIQFRSLANGVASVNATVWIVECAPSKHRGRMAAMQEFSMSVGSVVAQAVGIPFSSDEQWPMVFLPNLPISIAALFMFFFVYESPQFLVEKLNDREAARQALAAYHGTSLNDSSIEAELWVCEEAVEKKRQRALNRAEGLTTSYDGIMVMFNPFRYRDPMSRLVRWGAWLGVMVKVFLVDRLGRRLLMIASTAISVLCLSTMNLGTQIGDQGKIIALFGLTGLLLVNACGLGSVSRFYAAELVPRSLLLNAVSILTAFEALAKIGVEFAWYPLAADYIGSWSLFLFIGPSLMFLVLMYSFCPETSKKSVNEVLNELAKCHDIDVSFIV